MKLTPPRRAARGELGVRIKNMDKPLLCGKTAKDYKFFDNLMYHYKNLAPMYDKKVDFQQYTRWPQCSDLQPCTFT